MTEERTTSAVVHRVLPAPPIVAFDEWLDPEALAEFICPYPTRAGIVECRPRRGPVPHRHDRPRLGRPCDG